MKRCPRCGEEKPPEEFRARKGRRTVQSWCRPCKTAYDREWYRRNRDKHRAAINELRFERADINRRLLRDTKAAPCADCGVRYPPYVMDFDHAEGEKMATVGRIVRNWPTERLVEEIAKCAVVCANCHRERTFGPHGRYADA